MNGICPTLSVVELTIIGILLDGFAGLLAWGPKFKPINYLAKLVWPWYRQVSLAGESLWENREITKDQYGFETLAKELLPPEVVVASENLKMEPEEVSLQRIEFEDKESPLTDESEIIVTATESTAVEETFSLTHTQRMNWETVVTITKKKTNRVFRRVAVITLLLGTGLLIYAQISHKYPINLDFC